MATKKNGNGGKVDVPEMRKLAKGYGIKFVGRGQDEVLTEVLDAIEKEYGEHEKEEDFEEWKKANEAKIKFHIDNTREEGEAEGTDAEPPEPLEPPEPAPKDKGGKPLQAAKAKVKAAKAKVAAKPKKADKMSFTRVEAFVSAIKKGGVKEKLIATTDAEYVKKGGASNEKESLWIVNYGLKFLTALEYVAEKDGRFTLIK